MKQDIDPSGQLPRPEAPSMPDRRRLLKAAFLGGSIMFLGGSEKGRHEDIPPLPDCRNTPLAAESTPIPPEGLLLTEKAWHMPGIEQQGPLLRVEPMPITIYNNDDKNEADQRTLPLWPDLRFDGRELQVTARVTLDSSQTRASLLLGEELPITYDNFQFPGKSIRVTVEGAKGTVEVWDGEHQAAALYGFTTEKTSLQKVVSIVKKDGQLTIIVDGQPIKVVSNFGGTQTWLGLEAAGGGCDVSALHVKPLGKVSLAATDLTTLKAEDCEDGLRTLAKRRNPRCTIGAAVAVSPLYGDGRYAAIAAGNFNLVTIENPLKPQFIQPQEGVFTPQEAQRIVGFAKRHGMAVHGHALIPNRSFPKWMRDLPTKTDADKARIQTVLVQHIEGTMGYFPDIVSWDVVNEPQSRSNKSGWGEGTVFQQAMGNRYVNVSFAAAYRANPNALLFINDYAMDKANAEDEQRFLRLLGKLIEIQKELPGAKLGMGFEGHVYRLPDDQMSPADLKRRMAILEKHGFLARVSEMDVTTHYEDSPESTPRGYRIQAQQFGDIARVCMKAPNCISMTMWGIGGKYVSTAGVGRDGRLSWGSNLPWDKNLRQRPATYRALQRALT